MPVGAITLADITSADWSLKLGEFGSVVEGFDDVEQCIAIILSTPKGSDALRPTFGADLWRYIDSPITAAIPAIVGETTTAITLWEPRIKVSSVKVMPVVDGTAQSGAHLSIAVTWQLKLDAWPPRFRTTIVTVTRGA